LSKYGALWRYIGQDGRDSFVLTFAEIREILGFPIDHSFLNYKKELQEYGYKVGKISLKDKTIIFLKQTKI
jgi:hypothetical protein